MINDNCAERIAHYVNCRTESVAGTDLLTKSAAKDLKNYSQKPIDCDDDSDVFSGQADSVENHDHRNQSGLRDSSCADRSGSGSYTKLKSYYSTIDKQIATLST